MPNDITDEDLELWIQGEFSFDSDEGLSNQPIIIQDDYIIVKRAEKEGFNCCKCGEYYEYAKTNQEDGTFKCWGCRH